jgi:hypothetical protein
LTGRFVKTTKSGKLTKPLKTKDLTNNRHQNAQKQQFQGSEMAKFEHFGNFGWFDEVG